MAYNVREEFMFRCDACGLVHVVRYTLTPAGGRIEVSKRAVPFRMEGLDGKYCNLTCATRALIRQEIEAALNGKEVPE